MDSGQLIEPRAGEAAVSCYAAYNWNKLLNDLTCLNVKKKKSRLKINTLFFECL